MQHFALSRYSGDGLTAAPAAALDNGMMAVLRLPETLHARTTPAAGAIDEPDRSVYVRTVDPPCAVLPVGSAYDNAYDFLTLDTDPMEFAEQVPAKYQRAIRSGTATTAYDVRQLVDAVKANAHNHGVAPEQRSYVLDTDKGACALNREQYVDLWDQAHDRPSAVLSGDAAYASDFLASSTLDEIVMWALVPEAIEAIMSNSLARHILASRLSEAYVATPRRSALRRDLTDVIWRYYTSTAVPESIAPVADAEMAIAMGMRDPGELHVLMDMFGEETSDAATLAIESLFAALDDAPGVLSLCRVERIAKALIDTLPLDGRPEYEDALGLATDAGADDLARHIVEERLDNELNAWAQDDLVSRAEENGDEDLADYFREVGTH